MTLPSRAFNAPLVSFAKSKFSSSSHKGLNPIIFPMGHDFSTFKKTAKSRFEFAEIDANKLSDAIKNATPEERKKRQHLSTYREHWLQ